MQRESAGADAAIRSKSVGPEGPPTPPASARRA
ncbi:DUF6053 domain-containing protein [Lysobacter enzymogenes]